MSDEKENHFWDIVGPIALLFAGGAIFVALVVNDNSTLQFIGSYTFWFGLFITGGVISIHVVSLIIVLYNAYKSSQGVRPNRYLYCPLGVLTILIGLFAFCASAIFGSGATSNDPPGEKFLASLVSGALNPIFFIGIPLGIYWRYLGAQQTASQKNAEDNPKLIHCPDCGGHVSRLANSCPHCGRPLQSSDV
jgi:hypothetical protein